MKTKKRLLKPKKEAELSKRIVLYNTPTVNENCQCCTVNMSTCKK